MRSESNGKQNKFFIRSDEQMGSYVSFLADAEKYWIANSAFTFRYTYGFTAPEVFHRMKGTLQLHPLKV